MNLSLDEKNSFLSLSFPLSLSRWIDDDVSPNCDVYNETKRWQEGRGERERYEEDNKPLKLIWSDERGWYFPTKEELFRQQCTVTNKLRKSESLMAQELARLKSTMEKRDAHIETLEKSLVQLSIEWYTMAGPTSGPWHPAVKTRRRAASSKKNFLDTVSSLSHRQQCVPGTL